MAQVTWTASALGSFSPEELECAQRGGSWDRATQTCTPPGAGLTQPVIVVPPPGSSTTNTGAVDPQQMFDDGFVYINGKWVKGDSAEALAYMNQQSGGRAGMSSVQPATVIPGGSVLGYEVPAAPAVLLPSFVGGRLGEIRLGGGMRPASGGAPSRVRMGPVGLPVVRMGVMGWGR